MSSKFLKQLVAVTAGGRMALGLGAGSAQAKTDLLVYTAIEADELSMFKKAFESDYPDINIKWVRDSTGIVTSKLMAEKNNPKADIVWGLAATSLMMLGNEGYFQGYAPKGLKKLDKLYYDYSARGSFPVLPAHIERDAFADPAESRHRTLYDAEPTNPGLSFGPYSSEEHTSELHSHAYTLCRPPPA